jgi:hypothetical protein
MGDGLSVVDLDDCFTSDGSLSAEASRLVEMAGDTYIEVSPSGRGLHIWLAGSCTRGRRIRINGQAVELYGTGRFMTVTRRAFRNAPARVLSGDAVFDYVEGKAASRKPAAPDKPRDGQRVCAGCESVFDIPANERNPRRWCSEACRVKSYRSPAPHKTAICIDCPADVPRRGKQGPKRCPDCKRAHLRRYQASCRPKPGDAGYEEYLQTHRVYSRSWQKRNPDKGRERVSRRRASKAGVDSEPYNRNDIFERDGWICQLCHEPIDPDATYRIDGLYNPRYKSIDHIVPLIQGGPDTPDNVQASHQICNSTARDKR